MSKFKIGSITLITVITFKKKPKLIVMKININIIVMKILSSEI